MSDATLKRNNTLTLNQDYFEYLSELTLIVEDFGEDVDSEFASNLIELGRTVELAEDCQVRIGSADAKTLDARIYVLSDVILVGKYKRSRKKSKRTLTATQDKIVFGANAGAFETKDDISDAGISNAMSKISINRDDSILKLKMWVDLNGRGIQIREIQKGNNHGIGIVYTNKETLMVDGEVEYVTNVDQTELFFESKEDAEKIFSKVNEVMDALLLKEMSDSNSVNTSFQNTRAESMFGDLQESNRSVGTARTGKARGYAKGKKTFRQRRLEKNKESVTERKASAKKGLEELVKRYKVQEDGPKANKDVANFSVSFKPGPLGLSLGSTYMNPEKTKTIVFVSDILENGMADLSGVTRGDRVVEIGGVKVEDGMLYPDCVKIIKEKRSFLDEQGKPVSTLIKFSREKSVEEEFAEKREKKRLEELRIRVARGRKKRGNARRWKTRKKTGTFQAVRTLKDLEKKYKNGGDKTQEKCDELLDFLKEDSTARGNKHEKQCAYNLDEIYNSEKKYLTDLYMIRDHYRRQLEKAKYVVMCRDSGEKFCEHDVAAETCELQSSTIEKVLSRQDSKIIFGSTKVVTQLNETLLSQLQDGLLGLHAKWEKDNSSVTVADIASVYAAAFIMLMPFLKMYTMYAAGYAGACDRLNYLREHHQAFFEKLNSLESKKGVKKLNSLMLVPVQRLTKYPLLFSSLTKEMRPYVASVAQQIVKDGGSAQDGVVEKLTKAIDDLDETNLVVRNVAVVVDYQVDEQNKNAEYTALFHELGGTDYVKNFMQANRRYLARFEDIIYEGRKGSKTYSRKNRVVVLLNDLMIIGDYSKAVKSNKTLTKAESNAIKNKHQSQSRLTSSKSMVGSKKGTKIGKGRLLGAFSNFGKKKESPNLRIEYMIEMKSLKMKKLPRKGPEDRQGVTCTFSAIQEVEEEANKRKSKKRAAPPPKPRPVIVKLEIFPATTGARDELLETVVSAIKKNKEYAKSSAVAKQIMGKKKLDLRQRRRRGAARANPEGKVDANSSESRQETLRKKLESMRA